MALSLFGQSVGFNPSSIGGNGILQIRAEDTYYDGNNGTTFTAVPLPLGASRLQFRVTGGVTTDPTVTVASADGLYADGTAPYDDVDTDYGGRDGTYLGVPVGATTGIDPALFGVFFNPNFVGVPQDSLDFRATSGILPDPRTLPSYAPFLNQPFYIGDGYTSNNDYVTNSDSLVPHGTNQTFTIPAGATYLLLGIGADVNMMDNRSSFDTNSTAKTNVAFLAHVFDDSASPPVIAGVKGSGPGVYPGLSLRASVLLAAGASPLSYQWLCNGTNLADSAAITGSLSNTLSIANVTSTNGGNYNVIVSNAYGMATSEVTMLVVAPEATNCTPSPEGLIDWWPGNGNANDVIGTNNGILVGPVGFASGYVGDAFSVNGSNAFLARSTLAVNPQGFTEELWFQTTTTQGGELVGFGDSQVGIPANYDRHIYMDNLGKLHFGVYDLGFDMADSSASYNDGSWHYVAATLSAQTGMSLYVDGSLVASNPLVKAAQVFAGWWRIGENNLEGWPDPVSSYYFNGLIDAVGIYMRPLSPGEITAIYPAGPYGKCGDAAPTIFMPPVSQIVLSGASARFEVDAAGTQPLSFQWLSDGVNLADNSQISGSQSNVLTLSGVSAPNAGTYEVLVINAAGSTNVSATLTVNPPGILLAPTNLVVARIGDGIQPLVASYGNSLFLDQYTTNGAYINTISIPDSGPSALIVDGSGNNGVTESSLHLSTSGLRLTFAGYHAALPSPNNLTASPAARVPRAIGSIDATGFCTLAVVDTNAYDGQEFRCVVSTDGLTNFWTAASSDGIKYIAPAIGPDTQITTNGANPGSGNVRVLGIFNGLLYASCAVSTAGLWVFNWLPISSSAPSLVLSRSTNSSAPDEFAVSPDGKTIYLADDDNLANGGGVERWDNNGGTWVLNYVLSTVNHSRLGTDLGARGLTVDFHRFSGGGSTGSGAVIYATTSAASANKLIRITDTAGTNSTVTVLATAGVNELFRGVSFGPFSPPLITSQPASATTQPNKAVDFTVGVAGSPPINYQWLFNGTNLFNATNSLLVLSSVQAGNAGIYQVVASNAYGTVTSSTASLNVLGIPVLLHIGTNNLSFSNGQFGFQLSGLTGQGPVVIQTSTNLIYWVPVYTNTPAFGTSQFIDSDASNYPTRFYRAFSP
jgi:hypothetical protein